MESPFVTMLMYSDDKGVDGLAVSSAVVEKNSAPEEVAEDVIDCLRCVPGPSGEVSMIMKLEDNDRQLEDAEKEAKSSSSASRLGVMCTAAVISQCLAPSRQ